MRRQAYERLMFVAVMALASSSMSPEQLCWTMERSNHWWEHIAKASFTSQHWLENFRVSKQNLSYLCDELRASIEKNDTNMRKAVPTDVRVALTLWFLATGADYRTIGHLFGVTNQLFVWSSKMCVLQS